MEMEDLSPEVISSLDPPLIQLCIKLPSLKDALILEQSEM